MKTHTPFSLLITFVFLNIFVSSYSQNSQNYNTTSGTNASLLIDNNGNAIDLSTIPNLISPITTTANTLLQQIGFDFIFMGKYYTHFIAGNDGQIAFGLSSSPTTILSGTAANDLTRTVAYPPTSANNAPVLAAFWDNLRTSSTGMTIRSILVGVAPNRCRVIQWNAGINTNSPTSTDTCDGMFQVRLYEGTNGFEYVYGKMTVGSSGASGIISSSIGFTAGSIDNSFLALNDLNLFSFTAVATSEPATQNIAAGYLSGPITPLHSTSEGSRRFIRFSPANPPSGTFNNLTFTNITSSSYQLNWVDNFTNELGYLIYKSTDGLNFDYFTTTAANTNSLLVNNLASGTNYTWRVTAFTEGQTTSIANSQFTSGCQGGLSGIIKVGPNAGDNYTTLTLALAAIKANGLAADAIIELQAGYNPVSETYPLQYRSNPCQDLKTLTIRPASNVTSIVFTSAGANTFILDSLTNFILDGRPGGTGSGKEITVQNTSTSGIPIIFRNDANKDTIRNIIIKGNNSVATGAAMVFSTTTFTKGNSNNVIESCDFTSVNTTTGQQIYAAGTSGKENSGNTIRNCNFILAATVSAFNFDYGVVNIIDNNTGWIIDSNSFYSPANTFCSEPLSTAFIRVYTPTGKGFRIKNNFIGGTSAQCGGTVSVLSLNGGPYSLIYLATSTSDSSYISGNNFSNFTAKQSLATAYSALIYMKEGLIVCENNTVGSNAGTDNVTFFFQNFSGPWASAPTWAVIKSGITGSGSVIRQNVLGGIRMDMAPVHTLSSSTRFRLHGISMEAGSISVAITNNTIGSATVPNSIYSKTSSTQIMGIYTAEGNHVISGNTIQNIRLYGDTVNSVYGIYSALHVPTIQNNIIRNLSITSGETTSALTGIQSSGIITGNTIHTLNNQSLTGVNISVTGISDGNAISENFIHSLSAYSNSTTVKIDGILNPAESAPCRNNMIRLGIDSAGNSITGDYAITGIRGRWCANYLHNSIYIGGQVSNSTNNSTCISINNGCFNNFINNILVNYRSNIAGSGNHYNYVLLITETPFSVSNGNIFDNQQGGFKSRYANVDYNSLSSWLLNVKKDSLSFVGTPGFINPTGNASTVDLHVVNNTIAEGNGVYISSPTTPTTPTIDFDGQVRASNTPVDIGADAGLFNQSDIFGPFIIPGKVTNHLVGTQQTITALVRDGSFTDTSSTLKPRLWFRRSFPSASNWFSVAGTLISGTAKYGNWQFLPDYAAAGLNVNGADTIQYYFVAQDTVSPANVGYSPVAGALHSNVNSQVTPPSTLYAYRIIPILPDTILVGSGNTFTSLTRSGGLFEAFNSDFISLNKNLVVLISSDLTEDGTNILTNTNLNGYRLTIAPSAGVLRNISNTGNLVHNLVTISGAKRIFINGSFNGTGKYLRFVNTHTIPKSCLSTINVFGSCDSITLANIIVESNLRVNYGLGAAENAAIYIGTGNNTNILIQGSSIKNAVSGTPGTPDNGIFSNSTGNTINIIENDIFNFNFRGVSLYAVGGNSIIRSNHFYYNMPTAAGHSQNCIVLGNKGIIENNFIGGSERGCGGAPWLNDGSVVDVSNGSFNFIGIVSDWVADTTFIRGNTIQNINITATVGSFFVGINSYGAVKISNNLIGHPSNPNSIIHSGTASGSGVAGMSLQSNYPIEVNNNIVANINGLSVIGLQTNINAFVKIANNRIYNLTSGSAATGISLSSPSQNASLCEGNSIWSLKANNTTSNIEVKGIEISSNSSNTSNINRNRIYDLQNFSASNGLITGIKNTTSGSNYTNNQIALTNGTNTNNVTIRGIYSSSNVTTSNYYYNSIYIGGSVTGNANSYAVSILGNNTTKKFYNNLLYNERISGTGIHYAISAILNNQSLTWTPATSNYNLFVTKDTAKVGEWGVCCSGLPKSMREWRAVTAGDTSSFGVLATTLPASSIFINKDTGNLNINNTNSLCWYVNGKGIPVSGISGDYDSALNVRSTIIANGPTDIGSDEFNTNTLPIPLVVNGVHLAGGADTLSQNGRIVAIINWGNSGTIPTIGNARLFSGVWPNDTTNNGTVSNARYMSSYLDIPVTGGNNYSYSLKLYYDSSMLGKILNGNTMLLNKRQSNTAGSWISFPSTIVNTTLKTITVNNITSFSEFTATDAGAVLSTNLVQLCSGGNTNLTSQLTGAVYQWQLDTGSGYNNISDNSNFTGSNSLILQLNNIPSTWYGYKLRCVVDGINTVAHTIRIVSTWTGAVNSLWENPSNWTCGIIPDENTDVIISSGIVVLNSNQMVRSLQLSTGVLFTVNGGNNLKIMQ